MMRINGAASQRQSLLSYRFAQVVCFENGTESSRSNRFIGLALNILPLDVPRGPCNFCPSVCGVRSKVLLNLLYATLAHELGPPDCPLLWRTRLLLNFLDTIDVSTCLETLPWIKSTRLHHEINNVLATFKIHYIVIATNVAATSL